MTPYALLLGACGLSYREAAALHGVRLDTVQSWSSGRRETPKAVLAELRLLHRQIERAVAEAAAMMVRQLPDTRVEIGYPADDAEAQALGWPCVGAWRAMAGRVIAAMDRPVALVPRGSTAASAAAMRAAGRP